MAKKGGSITVKLLSTEGTGFFYVRNKNPRAEKLEVRKYDPVARKHATFKETKVK